MTSHFSLLTLFGAAPFFGQQATKKHALACPSDRNGLGYAPQWEDSE